MSTKKKNVTDTKPVKVKEAGTTTRRHDAPGGDIKHVNHADGNRTTIGATRVGC